MITSHQSQGKMADSGMDDWMSNMEDSICENYRKLKAPLFNSV
jgi:hypothetical protein